MNVNGYFYIPATTKKKRKVEICEYKSHLMTTICSSKPVTTNKEKHATETKLSLSTHLTSRKLNYPYDTIPPSHASFSTNGAGRDWHDLIFHRGNFESLPFFPRVRKVTMPLFHNAYISPTIWIIYSHNMDYLQSAKSCEKIIYVRCYELPLIYTKIIHCDQIE